MKTRFITIITTFIFVIILTACAPNNATPSQTNLVPTTRTATTTISPTSTFTIEPTKTPSPTKTITPTHILVSNWKISDFEDEGFPPSNAYVEFNTSKWHLIIDKYEREVLSHNSIANCSIWAFHPLGIIGDFIKNATLNSMNFVVEGWGEPGEERIYHYSTVDNDFFVPTITAQIPDENLDRCEADINEMLSTIYLP